MSGTIGVIADELSRYSAFTVSLVGVDLPEDWTIRVVSGRNIVSGCNLLVREFEGDWLWLQGDDHIFATDTLKRLISSADDYGADVMVPLMLMRKYPFAPVVYEGANDDGLHRAMHKIPPDTVIEVFAAGSGGMLISRHALEALGPDPFSFTMLDSGEVLGEDLTLSAKLREAGFPIYCDTSITMGHLTTMAVWPDVTDEGVATRIEFNAGAVSHA